MDLQTVKTQYGAHWAWARTGALILFLVTAFLLALSLTADRNSDTAKTNHQTGISISALLSNASAG